MMFVKAIETCRWT